MEDLQRPLAMTRQTKFLTTGFTLLSLYLSLWFRLLPTPFIDDAVRDQIVPCVRCWLFSLAGQRALTCSRAKRAAAVQPASGAGELLPVGVGNGCAHVWRVRRGACRAHEGARRVGHCSCLGADRADKLTCCPSSPPLTTSLTFPSPSLSLSTAGDSRSAR